MELEMLYWHWLVLGVVLIVAEIFIPSFTILWFGLGALVVGVAALMVDSSNSQLARESAIGESGQVIKLPAGDTKGRLRFTTPILGEDEWEFSCDSEVALGDRLYIQEIAGDVLVVAKLS